MKITEKDQEMLLPKDSSDTQTAMDWLVKQFYLCIITFLFILSIFIAVFIILGIGWIGIKIWPITVTLFFIILFRLIYLDYKKGWKNLKETIKENSL